MLDIFFQNKNRLKTLLFFGMVAGWFLTVAAVVMVYGSLQPKTMRPEQPIEFPHTIHAGELGMDCLECHQYADKSIYAGLPDAELCMQCHEAVAVDKPEVAKLNRMYEEGQPVKWVRVYQTKPHVYFSHKRHVLSNVKCQQCHGPVELMTTAQSVTDLSMGWCLECHRNRNAPTECVTCHK